MPEFNPSDGNSCAPDWEIYKRNFLIYIDALGLDDKPGKRKVGVLLSSMGSEAIRIYDSFLWSPAVPAEGDNPGIPAQNKTNLEHVFDKFDQHFGVHHYRNIKRQEFLNTKRGNMTIMDYIADLKRKAERCEYGEQKDSLICDMVINGVNDSKCSEKLMEIDSKDLTLDKVVKTCRQVELTAAHLKTLNQENTTSVNKIQFNNKGPGRFQSRGMNNARGFRYPTQRQGSGYTGTQPYCDRCCKHHAYRSCPAFDQFCGTCGAKGHFKKSPRCNRNSQQIFRGRGFPPRRNTNRGRRSAHIRRVHYANNYEYDLAREFRMYMDFDDSDGSIVKVHIQPELSG